MKKIIHVVWSSGIGGIESLVLNLCVEQSKNKNLEVALFTAKSGGTLNDAAKKNHIAMHEGSFKKGSINLGSIKKCIEIFKQFDIIHIHSFNPTIAYAAIKSKKKIIYTEHGNFGFEREIKLAEKINRKILSVFINRYIDYITFNSKFTEKTSTERYGLKTVQKKVVYNGTTISSTPLQLSNESKDIKIGTVGRLVAVKKIDRLINAFAKIKDKKNYQISIVGDGPLRTELQDLSNKLGVSEQIKFEGFKTNLTEYFNNQDIVIIPSSGEAFGLVVLEAYNCGIPVVIFSDGGGMVEMVQQADPELIVSSTNELTLLLEKLPLIKQNLLSATSKERRKQITTEFSISKMEKELYSIYNSL